MNFFYFMREYVLKMIFFIVQIKIKKKKIKKTNIPML